MVDSWYNGDMTEATYTLDAEKDGTYFADSGLTAAEVANARANAERLGITILNVTEETELMSLDAMTAAFK